MIRVGVGVLLAGLACSAGPAAAQQPLDLGDFVNELKSCRPVPGGIAVAVIDFLDQKARESLDPRERDNVRAAMERALAGQGVRTTAMRDQPLLREWQREGGNKSETGLQESLRGMRDVAAVIVFELVRRDTDRLVWRARALAPDGYCSRPSADQSIPTVTAGDAFSIQSRFATIARQLFVAVPRPQSIALLPFEPSSGVLGDCDEELPALLDNAIAEAGGEESAARNVISDRRITRQIVRRGEPAGTNDAMARGTYGTDERGRLWVTVQVTTSAGASLFQLPQTLVTGTSCRGITRSLVDHVQQTVRSSAGLSLGMPVSPRVGELVEFTIRNQGARPLGILCWNVASDNTAQVATQFNKARRLDPGRSIKFPGDFDGRSCFAEQQRDLFGCFGIPGPLSPAARELWNKAWPENRPEPQELSREETLRLLDAMRSVEGVVEAAERYTVGPAVRGRASACGMPAGQSR